MTQRLSITAALAALPLVWSTPAVHAQGTWDAMLTIQAFPSPYYSDWDTNPNIGSLTVMNHTASAEDVRIFFTITDRMNRVIARGNSEPETIAAGAVAIYDSPYEIAGSGSHDAEIERIASRTGRLPEGDYTACASAADASGFVLAEACADFFIAYPDPPLLLAPDNAMEVTEEAPLFQWTPVQVPMEYQLTYALRVVEVLEGQLPGEALAANIPVHEERDAFGTTFRYPMDARPLEPGRTYAWSVRALDQNGHTASANEGRSEIWTFEMEDPAGPARPAGGFTLGLRNGADPSPPSAGTVRLSDICRKARGPTSGDIELEMDVDPAFLPGNAEVPVKLFIDDATKDWALLSDDVRERGHQYLLYGRCDTEGPLGGLQWIARRAADLADLNMPIDTDDAASADSTAPAHEMVWRYGVMIVSLYPQTVGKGMPTSFEDAASFLGYREIKVEPGVNFYGEVNLASNGPLWSVLELLGHTDPYVALQGFVGLATRFSVGGHIGGTVGDTTTARGGAGAGAEMTVLKLRASLPPRPPMMFGGLIDSTRVAVELIGTVDGSAGWGTESNWTGGAVRLGASLSLAMHFKDGIERTASIGFVDAIEFGSTPNAAADTTTKGAWDNVAAVIKLESDREWNPLTRVPSLTIYSPDLEIAVKLANLSERIRKGTVRDAITGTIRGQLGLWELQQLARLEVQLGLRAAPGTGETRPRAGAVDEGSDPTTGRARSDADADQTTAPQGSDPGGTLEWKAGLALGNLTLGEALRALSVLITAIEP